MKRPNKKKPVVLVTAVGAPPGFNTLRFLHESGRYLLLGCTNISTKVSLL
jgi:hypothetical protein